MVIIGNIFRFAACGAVVYAPYVERIGGKAMEYTVTSIPRTSLLARLAAERAGLLYQLRGLDQETLCTTPVVDDWTARDLFPHLGYWDAVYADRLQRVADDRRHEITQIADEETLDELNAAARRQFSRASLGQAVAIAVKERNGFLAALARVPDDILFRRLQIAPDWRIAPSTWARWRHLHDAEHANDLARWRRQWDVPQSPRPPASKVILRPFLAAARQEFWALSSLIEARERITRPVCGSWTLRDVLGHITIYEVMGVIALQAISAGESPRFPKTIRRFDTFNEAQVVARQRVDWPQALSEWRAVRKALVTLLDQATDEGLARAFTAPWGTTISGYQYVFGLAIHEQEHAAALRQSLDLAPLPQRLRHYRAA